MAMCTTDIREYGTGGTWDQAENADHTLEQGQADEHHLEMGQPDRLHGERSGQPGRLAEADQFAKPNQKYTTKRAILVAHG